MPTNDSVQQTDPQRSIGLLGATAIGIGGMVGGGIFAVLGVASQQAGGATPVAFAVAGVVAALTAASYARLSVQFQSGGGTVTFVDKVFGISELTGSLNIVLWAGYIVTTALYASAFGNYAATLFPGGTNPRPLVLRALIGVGVIVPWVINLAKAGLVARAESVIVAIKLAMLMVVIAAGIPSVSVAHVDPSAWPSPFAILAAGMLIFVAYEGFELIANASAEVKRPATTLPRAFALSVGLVIVLYVVIALVVVSSLSPSQIAASSDFALAQAASASLGRFGFVLVSISAVLATFSAINATLYGAARLSFTIATEGELPASLETRTWHQPVGLHITALTGLVLAVALRVASISALASAIFLAVFAVVNAAALKHAASPRWAKLVAAAGLIGCLASLAIVVVRSVIEDPIAMQVLVVLLISALAAEHLILKKRRRRLLHGVLPILLVTGLVGGCHGTDDFGITRTLTTAWTAEAKESQRQAISARIDEIIKGANRLDVEAAARPYSSDPDFWLVNPDGSIVDYQTMTRSQRDAFKTLVSVHFRTIRQDFIFLSNGLTLCT